MSAPSGMARHLVRRYTESHMTSQITILRGALSLLNPATGIVGGLAGATTIYQGKARIHTVSGSGAPSDSGAPIDTRSTTISIPITAPIPNRDDVITVQATNVNTDGTQADADLDTRVFRVLEVEGGSFFGDARRMSCTQAFDSRYWRAT